MSPIENALLLMLVGMAGVFSVLCVFYLFLRLFALFRGKEDSVDCGEQE